MGMVILLTVAYIFVHGAVSVMERTRDSIGYYGILILISSSLIYLAMVALVRRLGQSKKDITPCAVLWVMGAPKFLLLGIIALISKVSLERLQVERKAYALQVLIVVCALYILVYLFRFAYKSFIAWRESEIVDNQRYSELWSDVITAHQPSTIFWRDMSAWARFSFVATCLFEAALWTCLTIYYRYYCYSFLGQLSWAMVSLWLFVIFQWFGCVAVFLSIWPLQLGQVTRTSTPKNSDEP